MVWIRHAVWMVPRVQAGVSKEDARAQLASRLDGKTLEMVMRAYPEPSALRRYARWNYALAVLLGVWVFVKTTELFLPESAMLASAGVAWTLPWILVAPLAWWLVGNGVIFGHRLGIVIALMPLTAYMSGGATMTEVALIGIGLQAGIFTLGVYLAPRLARPASPA